MNPLASLIPQHKKNNLIRWLNSKPSISANLAPIQKFVQRTTKGAHSYFGSSSSSSCPLPDDQTVDTTSTWDDTNVNNPSEHGPRIKQTVVIISRDPPVTSILASDPEETWRRRSMGMRQRKSQQKNKVLMLLQLEQVTSMRTRIKERWRELRTEVLAEVKRRQTYESQRTRIKNLETVDAQTRARSRRLPENPILALSEYYRRFDTCLDELQERNEIMDLEAFKQLVIREVQDRADALNKFRERLKVVHGQLMQKFIVEELIEGGLYTGPSGRRPNEIWNEWIEIDEDINDPRNAIAENPGEGSEWVVCDF
jgi:hypothetical protein